MCVCIIYNGLYYFKVVIVNVFFQCHLWKTGGYDYDGCIVISNLKIYFLSHSRTNFKWVTVIDLVIFLFAQCIISNLFFREDTCDWLSKFDCYNLKDIKEIAPLLWQQGARIQIKHISYLALLMDKNRNQNFFKFLIGISNFSKSMFEIIQKKVHHALFDVIILFFYYTSIFLILLVLHHTCRTPNSWYECWGVMD